MFWHGPLLRLWTGAAAGYNRRDMLILKVDIHSFQKMYGSMGLVNIKKHSNSNIRLIFRTANVLDVLSYI